jgi:hypothetical protein
MNEKRVGMLRLHVAIRFANGYIPLNMTRFTLAIKRRSDGLVFLGTGFG